MVPCRKLMKFNSDCGQSGTISLCSVLLTINSRVILVFAGANPMQRVGIVIFLGEFDNGSMTEDIHVSSYHMSFFPCSVSEQLLAGCVASVGETAVKGAGISFPG